RGVEVREPGDSDRFCLTELGEALLAREDSFDLEHGQARADVFPRLVDSIRTGNPAYPLGHGRSFWEDLDDDPRQADAWAGMFGRHAAGLAPRVVDLP